MDSRDRREGPTVKDPYAAHRRVLYSVHVIGSQDRSDDRFGRGRIGLQGANGFRHAFDQRLDHLEIAIDVAPHEIQGKKGIFDFCIREIGDNVEAFFLGFRDKIGGHDGSIDSTA